MKYLYLPYRAFLFSLLMLCFVIGCNKSDKQNPEQDKTQLTINSSTSDKCHSASMTYRDTCINGQRVFKFFPVATPYGCAPYVSFTLNFGDGTPPVTGTAIPTGPINHIFANAPPYTVTFTLNWPPCHTPTEKCDTTTIVTIPINTVAPCGNVPTDSCPRCTVSVREDSCIRGTDGIVRRRVTFTPSCSGPVPTFFSYNLQGGTTTGTLAGPGAPGTISVLYQSSPFPPPPTLTVYGPGNCPQSTVTIPYFTATPCPPAPSPCPDITKISVNIDSCSTVGGVRGHNVTLTPNVTGGTPTSFLWAFSHGTPIAFSGVGMPSAVTHFYPTSSGGPYSAVLYIIGANGQICDSFTVTFPLTTCTCSPCATVTSLTASAPTDCSQIVNGDYVVTFTATISPECPPVQYLWNFGDGQTQTTTTPQVQHTYHCPHSAPPYLVTVNLIGCDGNPYYVSPSMSVPVSFIACECPTINNITVNQQGCKVDVSASISGHCPEAVTQYIWDFGDGTSVAVNAPSTTASHTYTSGGDYWVTLTLAGVGPNCYSSEQIHVCCGDSCDECFKWPHKKWYCWLYMILFGIAFAALIVVLFIAYNSNTWQSWVIVAALFVVALVFAILLALHCNCCFALWSMYYLLLMLTIIVLIMAFNNGLYWGSFFMVLVLTVIVAVVIFLFCTSCLALWILFTLFLILSIIFLGYALCILSGTITAPANFWLKFIIMIVLAIILAIIIQKLCGASMCEFLIAMMAGVGVYASIMTLIDQQYRPCTNWLTGSLPIPSSNPIFHIPYSWFYTLFFWLLWYIVCRIFG